MRGWRVDAGVGLRSDRSGDAPTDYYEKLAVHHADHVMAAATVESNSIPRRPTLWEVTGRVARWPGCGGCDNGRVAAQQSGTDEPASAHPAEPDESSTTEVALPQVFRIQKVAYFTVPMVLVVTIILSGASLVWLGWTLILPVLLAIWIGRIRTIVTEDGIRAVHTFGTRDIPWGDIAGLQFPRWGSVRAVLTDKSRVRLPAIMFQDLPRLSAASGGRIPDPYPHRR